MTAPDGSVRAGARRSASAARARARRARVFARVGARTEPARVFETGGLRLRFPRATAGCEAVLINTGGGMAGGDRAKIALALEAGAEVLFTTQSAEKIYRSDGETSRGRGAGDDRRRRPSRMAAAGDDSLSRARVSRAGWTIDLAADASPASRRGGHLRAHRDGRARASTPRLRDSWRIRRAGRLVFAEELRLDRAGARPRSPRRRARRPRHRLHFDRGARRAGAAGQNPGGARRRSAKPARSRWRRARRAFDGLALARLAVALADPIARRRRRGHDGAARARRAARLVSEGGAALARLASTTLRRIGLVR